LGPWGSLPAAPRAAVASVAFETREAYGTGPTLTKSVEVTCPGGKKALRGAHKIDPLHNMLAKDIDIELWWSAPAKVNVPSPAFGWNAAASRTRLTRQAIPPTTSGAFAHG
jgi:hypothetical protein